MLGVLSFLVFIFIYLFGCSGSLLQLAGHLTFISLCVSFSCSM